jgi:hypothetical protein
VHRSVDGRRSEWGAEAGALISNCKFQISNFKLRI